MVPTKGCFSVSSLRWPFVFYERILQHTMQNELEPPPPSADQSTNGDWLIGIGLLILLHLIQIPLAAATMAISLMVISLTQLAYVIPLVLYFRKKGRPGIAKGLIIGAALTFLLHGTCTAMFFLNPPNFH